jgi:RsiW-degrading membrane proteinase PrsW (M82 family)
MTSDPASGQQHPETPRQEPPTQQVAPSAEHVPSVWAAPVRRFRPGIVALAITGIVVGGLSSLLVLVYLATFLGPSALLICLLLALIPLSVILLAVRWIDRWEPEPRPALWFALLWGGGVSIMTALIFDAGVQLSLAAIGQSREEADFVAAVIQAPIVEEVAKGFGILVLFWAMRRQFDGPIDGIVYGAMIAAGFAFSENVQYFGVAMQDGGLNELGLTFFVRAVMSPFAHVMFTACTGVALGIAARRTGPGGAVGYFFLGLIFAIGLHALWNGAFFLVEASATAFLYYVLVQVPLFLIAAAVVIFLRRKEEKTTQLRLGEYAAAGWFTTAEVTMLATSPGRRQARAWAKTQPRATRLAMRDFITDATRLAFARQRVLNHKPGQVDRAHEAHLLARLMADRAAVIGNRSTAA